MVPHEMEPGRRHKGGKLGYQIQGLKDDMRGSVAPAVLEVIEQPAVRQKGEALTCECRAARIAKEPFKPKALAARDRHIGMEAEA